MIFKKASYDPFFKNTNSVINYLPSCRSKPVSVQRMQCMYVDTLFTYVILSKMVL